MTSVSFSLLPGPFGPSRLTFILRKLINRGLGPGDTYYNFLFPVKDILVIFGMEIDNNLDFSR